MFEHIEVMIPTQANHIVGFKLTHRNYEDKKQPWVNYDFKMTWTIDRLVGCCSAVELRQVHMMGSYPLSMATNSSQKSVLIQEIEDLGIYNDIVAKIRRECPKRSAFEGSYGWNANMVLCTVSESSGSTENIAWVFKFMKDIYDLDFKLVQTTKTCHGTYPVSLWIANQQPMESIIGKKLNQP